MWHRVPESMTLREMARVRRLMPAALLAFLGLAFGARVGAAACDGPSFYTPAAMPADSGVTQVLAGDLDSDGDADLVVVRGAQRSFESRIHDSGTTFSPGVTHHWTTSILRATLADLDRDGRLDLACTDDASRVVIFRGVGDGTFAFEKSIGLGSPVHDLIAVDLNGTGGLELIVTLPTSGKLVTLMGSASPFAYTMLVTTLPASVPDPHRIVVGRINADLLVDVAVARRSSAVVWLGRGLGSGSTGNGAFLQLGTVNMQSPVVGLKLAYLDSDSTLDLVAGTNGGFGWAAGSGTGTFAFGGHTWITGGISELIATDFNRDGLRDLLGLSRSTGYVHQILAQMPSGFSVGMKLAVPATCADLAPLELGGSTDRDFVLACREVASLPMLLSRCEQLVSIDPPPGIRPGSGPPILPEPPPAVVPAPAPYFDPGPPPLAAAWPFGGVALCDAAGEQSHLVAADDLAHGAYFAWMDRRDGNADVYATRVGPDGSLVPGWVPNGTPVSRSNGTPRSITCLSDGPAGMWVAWIDDRDGVASLYVQRLTASGQVAQGWSAGGRRVCTSLESRPVASFSATVDYTGGLFLVWNNGRTTGGHLDADGNPATGWPACGIEGRADYHQWFDCAETWLRTINAVPHYPVGFLQSISWRTASALYDPWGCFEHDPHSGNYVAEVGLEGLSGVGSNDYGVSVHSDGQGGWYWLFGGMMRRSGGVSFPSWGPTYMGHYLTVPGVAGSFHTLGNSPNGVVLRLIDIDGQLEPGFGSSGKLVCTSPCVTQSENVVPDGLGGAVVAWADYRTTDRPDLYVTRYRGDGTRVAGWRPDGQAITDRGVDAGDWAMVSSRRGPAILGWREAHNGEGDLFAMRVTDEPPPMPSKARREVFPEQAQGQPRVELSMLGARPNPSTEDLTVDFTLSRAGSASLRVLDIAGREVARQSMPGLGAGRHSLAIRGAAAFSPGIYLLELAAEGRRLTSKVVVTR